VTPRRAASGRKTGGRPVIAKSGEWAVFLDRDGTLLHLIPYLRDPARARLYHGVGDALRRLKAAGARLVVITNQSGVARGIMTRADVAALHRRLRALLAEYGVRLDRIEVCFDHPDFNGSCDCRKPRPGMLLQAARELGIDLSRSWTIGDNASDIEAGAAAGTRTALVLTGYGRKTRGEKGGRQPDLVAASLAGAAGAILAEREAATRPARVS
jgi:histidinol-phosphate phosphatase family protein